MLCFSSHFRAGIWRCKLPSKTLQWRKMPEEMRAEVAPTTAVSMFPSAVCPQEDAGVYALGCAPRVAPWTTLTTVRVTCCFRMPSGADITAPGRDLFGFSVAFAALEHSSALVRSRARVAISWTCVTSCCLYCCRSSSRDSTMHILHTKGAASPSAAASQFAALMSRRSDGSDSLQKGGSQEEQKHVRSARKHTAQEVATCGRPAATSPSAVP